MLMTLPVPANTYDTQTQEALYAGSPDGWACKAEMSDDVAYSIVKALFDYEEEFQAMQPGKKGLKGVTRNSAVTAMFAIPFHPGAIKYYKEKGWM